MGIPKRGVFGRIQSVGVAVLFAVALVALARDARADGAADEAELHFQIGAERYRAGDYRDALEHFLVSNRLVPNANVVFNIARSYEALGRFPDAHRYYVDALESQNLSPRVRPEVEAAIARIAPNVAVVRVETDPPGATIYIDRRDLGSRGRSPRPLALPEGTYRVLVELDGYEPAQSPPVTLHLGGETPVRLTLRRIVGTVRIEGEAGASVHLDDERSPVLCVSPCSIDVAPGTHSVLLTRDGYQTQTRTVSVVPRQTSTIRAGLAPLTGSVVVSADERDALVEIDGRSVGFTPAVVPNVPVGRRHVRISLRGYTTVERDVDVRAGQQAELLDQRLVPVREVTAVSRFAESVDDAPSSVTIIPYQELRAFAYPTIAEALRGVRGFYLGNDRAYFSAGIRGIGQPNDYGNRVLVLSDGANLNDNLLNSSYIGSDGRADLYDVERIEVVRGPGSLLYGTGALSGVVNLVTRRRDEPTSVHAGFGTYDNAVAVARAGGYVNLGHDRGAWVSVSGARSDGVDVTVPVTDATGNVAPQVANRVDSFYSQGMAARAWWGPLSAQFFTNQREQHIPIGAYGTTFNDPRTMFVDTRWLGEIRFEPQLTNNVQLLTRVHVNRYTFHGEYIYDPKPNYENYFGTWTGAEARLLITPLRGMRITAGGEFQWHPEVTITGCCVLDDNGASTGQLYVNSRTPFVFGAVYAVLDWSITPWFRLDAGARVDIYEQFGAIPVPRAAAIFRPVPGGVLKIMGGRAFRIPSAYEQYYTDGGVTQIPAPNLLPESIWQGEIEYSQRFLEDWVALLSVWSGYIEDIIETDHPAGSPGLIQYRNNVHPVVNAGVDVELRREFRQGWMLSAMAGYQRAQYVVDNQSWEAGWLANAPEWLASFRAVMPIVQGVANGALRISAESGRRISIDNPTVTQPSVIADAVISGFVARFGVRYAIGIYNLLDWHYEYPVTPSFLSATMPQNGRTFRFDVSATF